MKQVTELKLVLGALLVQQAFLSIAYAQSAPVGPADPTAVTVAPTPTPSDGTTLDTVVVTAQRRSEQLQSVPISVKAFTAQQILDAGITTVQDFANLTPNMSFDQSFTYLNSFVVIRGVEEVNNADSPVAVVVDGVPQNNQKQFNMNLFDVQQIEVLKGPQGALYGRNAIGGAVNITTKQPTNQVEGFLDGSVGNGSLYDLSGGISGPIIDDTLLYRVSVHLKQFGGLIENTFSDKNVDKINHDNDLSGKLMYLPNDNFSLDLRASFRDFQAGGVIDSIVANGNPNNIVQPRSDLLGQTFGNSTDLSAKVTWDVPIGQLVAITGYSDLREDYRGDVDFSNPIDMPGGFFGLGFQAGQGQNLTVQQLSQEIRLTSAAKQPLRYIVGAYFVGTGRSLETRAFIDTDGSDSQFDDPSKIIVHNNEQDNNYAWATFGQLDYDLSKSTTISVAERYDRDNRQQINLNDGASRDASFSKAQPKATLTYRVNPDFLTYATYATGFRSGGFNSPGLPEFRPETLENYELGAKTTWWGGRLVLNADAYYSQDKNYQFFYVNAVTASQVISNVDRVSLKGVDIDFRALLTRNLELDGGIGTTDGRIEADAAQPTDIGNHTPKTSPIKVNLGAQYSAPTGYADLMGFVRGDYSYIGRKYWQTDNVDVQNPLNLFNLRLGVRSKSWEGYLYVKNLTDRRYYADYNPKAYSGLPYDIGSLAEGRTFGAEARFKF